MTLTEGTNSGELEFEYKGIGFTLTREMFPFAENDEEMKKEFKRVFDYCGEEIIVSVIEGTRFSGSVSEQFVEPIVNWKRYFEQAREYRGEQKLDDYTKVLVALGVLSLRNNKNWMVMSFGMNVNPKLRDTYRTYFTSQTNAEVYARTSGWNIDYVVNLGEVVYIRPPQSKA